MCWAHDPELLKKREQARSDGGRNSSSLARAFRGLPTDLKRTYRRLESAIDEVHDGTLEPNRASAMAALSRAMVTVMDAGEFADRIAAVEAKLQEPSPTSRY